MAGDQLTEILDCSDIGINVVDRFWRCGYRNAVARRWQKRQGLDGDYGVGEVIWEAYPQYVGTNVERALRRVMTTRRRATFDVTFPSGLEFSTLVFPLSDGGIVVFYRDVTARKQSDEREAFLLELSDRLRGLADPREIMRAAASLVGQHLRLAFVQYGLVEDGVVSTVVVYNDGQLPGLREGLKYRTRERRGSRPPDLSTDPVFIDGRAPSIGADGKKKIGVRASASIPLVKDDRLLAVFRVARRDYHVWSNHEKILLAEVAERTWSAAERARAQSALAESEKKYRTLFEQMGEGLAIAELVRDVRGEPVDYRYLEFNPAFQKHTGIQGDEFVGRLRSETLGVSTSSLQQYAELIETKKPLRYEHYEPQLSRWFSVYAFARGGDRFAVLYNDITTQRDAAAREKFLVELSARLQSLRDADAVLIAATTMLVEHLDVVRAYYVEYDEAKGYAKIRGEHVRDGAHSIAGIYQLSEFGEITATLKAGCNFVMRDIEESDLNEGARAQLAKNATRSQLSIPLIKDGVLVASVCVNDDKPRVWRAVEIDIMQETAQVTWAALERALAESALRAHLAEVESANRAKDEFLATVSHELRTPLASVLLWADALRTGKVPPGDQQRALDAIVQGARSQSQLIEDLLDLTRLAARKLALARRGTDIAATIRAAADIVRPIASAKHITLEVDAPPLGRASVDGARFQQVLWNLLNNGVKFTPDGGRVSVVARREGDALVVDVRDNGEGIEPALLPYVFDRFWQAEMKETRRHMGLGIGLALSKQLVELHGGTITAASEGRGCGAFFQIRLPWLAAEPEPNREELPLRGVTVLMVEHDESTSAAMRWTLTHAGAEVVAVNTVAEAVSALANRAEQLVMLCDVDIPDPDAYALVSQIATKCARAGRAPPPSCAMSASALPHDRARALSAGFDMFEVKPLTQGRLIEVATDLGDVLRRVHQSRDL